LFAIRRFAACAQSTFNWETKKMPQSTHDRVAELHNLAAHAHAAAAVAHGKNDYLSAHELTQQAHEHSTNARKLAEQLAAEHSFGNSPVPTKA
jgi:hypothetical protein